MVKPAAKANPKLGLMRGVFGKARPLLLRGVGELKRVQVNINPAVPAAERAKLEQQLQTMLLAELARTSLPVLSATEPLPAVWEGWVFWALAGARNAEHGLETCGVALAYVVNGAATAGGFLSLAHDEPWLAAVGEGATCGDRCRVSGRPALDEALVQLPHNSGDGAKLKLLELADAMPFHTRKSGCALVDGLLVAKGEADVLVSTQLLPMEHALLTLLLQESGAVVQLLSDRALLAGNAKLVNALAERLPKLA